LDATLGGRPVDIVGQPFSRRRMVYGYVDRQDLPLLFRTFDFANPDQSVAGRPQTTVPQQALFFMNSPFVTEQARHLAARAQDVEPRQRIAGLYRFTLSREPSAEELQMSAMFLDAARDALDGQTQLSPWEQLAQMLLSTNEFLFVD
jgi:hypothetical protein